MNSEISRPKKIEKFPCLMEFKLKGEVLVGIYMVSKKFDKKIKPNGYIYNVCQMTGDKIGTMYEKEDLNLEEWFFLPVGTSITITNE